MSDILQDIHARLAIRRRCTLDRADWLDHMTFARNIGPVFTEIFGPLPGVKEDWARQGGDPEELDFSAFRYRCCEFAHVPVNTGFHGGSPTRVISETPEAVVAIDAMGRRVKIAKMASSLPLPMEHPVETMDDWRRLKPHYLFREDRFADGWAQIARDHVAAGRVLRISIPGGYDEPRQLLGDERLCMAFYDQPELIADILRTLGDTAQRVLEIVCSEIAPDVLFVHEDMAGRSGPMIGPAQVRAFIVPYYRRCWEVARSWGTPLFDQDSDGDMTPLIETFLDAGVNCMHPFEPAAGMDIVAARERYGQRLAMYGGIDKHALRKDPAAIERELEYKIPPMIRTGGCMLALDHRVPNGVSLANYRFYVEKAWEIMLREASAAGLPTGE
jgi:hypothetical protein